MVLAPPARSGKQGDAARAGRDVHPSDLDAIHYLVAALARLAAEDLACCDPVALEHRAGGVDVLLAHLVDLPGRQSGGHVDHGPFV